MDKHAMVIRADARAMGAITALRVGGTRKGFSRTRTIALSDTLCTMVDGTTRIIPRNSRSTRKDGYKRTRAIPDAPTRRMSAADLPALFAD